MDNELSTAAPLHVFVTGATAELGREVARHLVAAGHQVTGTVASSAEAAELRRMGVLPAFPDLHRAGELRSALLGAGAKLVVNCAPQRANHLPQQRAAWDEHLVEGVTALLEAAAAAGIEFVVHTSYAFAGASSEEAGDWLRTVRRAERAVLRAEVPGCVLRFGYVYGPDSKALLAVREMLKRGMPVPAGSDTAPAQWVHAADAARAVELALLTRPAGALLTIADDHPATPAEFIRYFAEAQGLNAPMRLPAPAARALIGGMNFALMEAAAPGDTAEAKQKLGWLPRFTDYRAGIDDVLLSWRAAEPIQY
jgi:nucleoside-diphosphate-sugar epimerase